MATNHVIKIEANIIGNDYGFFPLDDIRFEAEKVDAQKHWGFYANKANRTLIHIKYDPQKLEPKP